MRAHRVASQMSLRSKVLRANRVISTMRTVEETRLEVRALWEKTLAALAAEHFQQERSSPRMTQQSPSVGAMRRRRRMRPAAPRRPRAVNRSSSFLRRQAALIASVPVWLRAGIVVLACTALALSCILVTRTYITHEAERRRLEQEAADRASHPLYFEDLIVRYAAENGVDPALVSAVILCESSFDPQAESRLGRARPDAIDGADRAMGGRGIGRRRGLFL